MMEWIMQREQQSEVCERGEEWSRDYSWAVDRWGGWLTTSTVRLLDWHVVETAAAAADN